MLSWALYPCILLHVVGRVSKMMMEVTIRWSKFLLKIYKDFYGRYIFHNKFENSPIELKSMKLLGLIKSYSPKNT